MTFESEFGDLCSATVIREPFVSMDGHGQPTFGTARSMIAHIIHKNVLTRTSEGRAEVEETIREVISSAQVYTRHEGWSTKDRITLDDGSQPLILHVIGRADHVGDHHQVVYV